MATLTDDFLDIFGAHATALVPAKWTSAPSATIVPGAGPWAGQNVMRTSTGAAYKTLTAGSQTILVACSWEGALNVTERYVLNIIDNTNLRPIGLQALSTGHLRIRTGGGTWTTANGTIIATTAAPKIQEDVYYTLELAVRIASTTDYSIEVRLDGVLLGELSTTDVGGAVNPATVPLLNWSPGQLQYGCMIAASSDWGWYGQKRGTGLWTSTTTGSTRATISDFPGVQLKIVRRLEPVALDAAVAPYGFSNVLTASLGITSNWVDGSGAINTFPPELTETLCDSDTGYVKNTTAPTSVPADSYGVSYEDLPGTATSVAWLQRTLVARSDSAVSAQIQTGMLDGTTPVSDGAAFTIGAQYVIYPRPQTQPPTGGTDIWTVANTNSAKAYTTLTTLT